MLPNTISDQTLGRAFRAADESHETQCEIAAWYCDDTVVAQLDTEKSLMPLLYVEPMRVHAVMTWGL